MRFLTNKALLSVTILISTLAVATPLEQYPEWDLSEHETEQGQLKHFLEPNDGRPTIAVTANAADRMRAGNLNPADVYRGDISGTRNQNSNATFDSAGGASSSATGNQYVRLGAPSGNQGRGIASPTYSVSGASGSLRSTASANAGTTAVQGSKAFNDEVKIEMDAEAVAAPTVINQPNPCPKGKAPTPDKKGECSEVMTVYSGNQIQGKCGANIHNLNRCGAASESELSYFRSCYTNFKEHGHCYAGFNCPSDAYPRLMVQDCGGKKWDPNAEPKRCFTGNTATDHYSEKVSINCLR